jgi:hypothetical protein
MQVGGQDQMCCRRRGRWKGLSHVSAVLGGRMVTCTRANFQQCGFLDLSGLPLRSQAYSLNIPPSFIR